MPVKKRGVKWIIDFWLVDPDGDRVRFRKTSPYQTKKESEELERQLIEDVSSTWTQPEERRYEDHAVEFLKTYAVANNKYSEVVTKESILRVHLIPAFGHLMLHEIGSRVIERYKASKLDQGLKPKSINNHLAVLRKSLAVAAEWGLLTNAPRVKQMRVAKPPFDFLDFEETDRLIAAADGVFRAMIVTAAKTGLRLGELRALRWEDVDLISRQLMVRQSVCRGKVGTPKSNRERMLPLCDTAVAVLKAERHLRGELVLCADDGRMLSKAETYSGLQRACRRAGLRKIGWHCLRHYADSGIMSCPGGGGLSLQPLGSALTVHDAA
jgi:integrase